jgi:hypothetical protein
VRRETILRNDRYINRRHLCLLDKDCWSDWWQHGMPLRFYDNKETVKHPHGWFITLIPGGWMQYLKGWRKVKND